MTLIFRFPTLALATCACACMLAGCATTQINSQWRDPGFVGDLARGGRLLVVCQASDTTLRRVCEDHWTVELGMQGITATRSYSLPGFSADLAASPDAVNAAARANGARAVINMQLAPGDVSVINPGPQMGVGVGGGSGGYHSGGFSFGGLGVSFPIGGATVTRGMASSTTAVDLASGAVVWSGNASAPAEGDVTAQISALAKVTVEALKKAGLIR